MVPPPDDPQRAAWQEMVARMQGEAQPPFDEQWRLFSRLAAERPPELGPMPAWWPAPDRVAGSNIGRLMAEIGRASCRERESVVV